ncbi:MAG: hypothetical protein JRJ84_09075 [Deltaproteobacteria bacterium]|nr:hypothetical protein [Deltaproteobacteria bacterium]
MAPEPTPEPGTLLDVTSLPLPEGHQVAGLAVLENGRVALITQDLGANVWVVGPEGAPRWDHSFTKEDITLPSGPLPLPFGAVGGFAAGEGVGFFALGPEGGVTHRRRLPHVNAYAAARGGDALYAAGSLETWSSPNGPFPFADREIAHAGFPHEAFVARFDLDGVVQWVTPLGIHGEAMEVDVDNVGNTYVSVAANGPALLVRVAPSGAVLWQVELPGSASLAVDGEGAPWLAGTARADEIPAWVNVEPPAPGPCTWEVGWVARLRPSDGTPSWTQVLDGTAQDIVGFEGPSVVVTGTTGREQESDEPGDVVCSFDGTVQAISPSGDVWRTVLEKPGGSYPQAVAVGPDVVVVYATAENVFLAGRSDTGQIARIAR